MRCLLSFSFVLLVLLTASARAGEIGYIEDFALADDRNAALKQLIPGTDDYYYYHALHYQNNEQFDRVDKIVRQWVKRHNYTNRVREILNRQALLTYPRNPQRSLVYLQRHLGLRFNHQREILHRKPNLPTELNQDLISRKTLTQRALRYYSNLNGFEDSALGRLHAPIGLDIGGRSAGEIAVSILAEMIAVENGKVQR